MTTVSDSYPKNQTLSDQELKEVLVAKYAAGNTKNDLELSGEPSKFHTEIVHLPSKGLLYPESSPLSSGQLEMKYMTAKEEDILTSQNLIKSGVVIDKLLQSLIVTKINYGELLVGDKNALLVAARILGYGKDYTFTYSGEEQTIDLTTIENKPIDESLFTKGINEFEYTLPSTGTKITFKLLTSADERKITAEIEGLKKNQQKCFSRIINSFKTYYYFY